jgi:hypothetical protein
LQKDIAFEGVMRSATAAAMGAVLVLAAFQASAAPLRVPPDGAATAGATGGGRAPRKTDQCTLEAASNPEFDSFGFNYFFSCAGDEIARRVDFDACIGSSHCIDWYPRTVTLRLWISAAECDGSYPYTTSPFEAQLCVYRDDPYNPRPACPRPAEEPMCQSAPFTVPAFTRTSPAGTDADVVAEFPLYCDCVRESPFFISFKWLGVAPGDDPCVDGDCVARLPGLRSTGSCETPDCSAPDDPENTLQACATYFRNQRDTAGVWRDGGQVGIRSDIVLSVKMQCCDAIGVDPATWGRVKMLRYR